MKKSNIIALLLFVAALIVVLTLDTTQTRSIQTSLMNVLSPFIRVGTNTENEIKRVISNPSEVASMQKEFERLQQKVAQLTIIEQKYLLVMEENNKFRAMLDYRKQVPLKLTAARVLRRSVSNWWNTIIIDRGSLDNLGTDSPVITEKGLVGKTGKVAAHTSEVILLTDEECRVAARIEGVLGKGILSGERGGFKVRPDLRLRFLDRTLHVEPGANVYSTGDGGIFPAGLLLGKVKLFEARDISGEAIVESAVDFSLLDDVFVVHVDMENAP